MGFVVSHRSSTFFSRNVGQILTKFGMVMFVDCSNFDDSCGRYSEGNLSVALNARQFVTLLSVHGNLNTWVRVSKKTHEQC